MAETKRQIQSLLKKVINEVLRDNHVPNANEGKEDVTCLLPLKSCMPSLLWQSMTKSMRLMLTFENAEIEVLKSRCVIASNETAEITD